MTSVINLFTQKTFPKEREIGRRKKGCIIWCNFFYSTDVKASTATVLFKTLQEKTFP